MSELLPCPFCGSAPVKEAGSAVGFYSIACENPACHATPVVAGRGMGADAKWNRRTALAEAEQGGRVEPVAWRCRLLPTTRWVYMFKHPDLADDSPWDEIVPLTAEMFEAEIAAMVKDRDGLNSMVTLLANEKRKVEQLTQASTPPPAGADEQGRWIPVGERLPERDGSYLTVILPFLGDSFVREQTYAKQGTSVISGWKYSKTTHWQPLPEPPAMLSASTKDAK